MTVMSHTSETTRSKIEKARQPEGEGFDARVNVGPSERILSMAGGLTLLMAGARKGSLGGLALAAVGGSLVYRAATGYCALYSALELDSAHDGHSLLDLHKGIKVQKTVTVNRSAADCYRFWRRFENLPQFMEHLNKVHVIDTIRSHWEAKAPLGKSVSWDAEILTDRPDELISWKSVGDSEIDNAGSVRFRAAPAGRGTEITVELNYEPPAGRVGAAIAWMLGEEPEIQVREDLRRFKQIMEAGEIPTVQGQPACR
ncbi:MAG: SRPBCC family protein [Isosphaeraceae bacterium]